MNKADVEFTVGLNTSPAEQELDKFYEKMKSRKTSNLLIEADTRTQPSDIIPNIPKTPPTTMGYEKTNLPAITLTREIEKVFSYFRAQSQGIPGWKYAGSSHAKSIYEEYQNVTNKKKYTDDERRSKWWGDNYDTPEEQTKNLVNENKKDNIELDDKLLKWGKILAIVYAIKKTLEGLSKIWKFGAETVTSRNANLDQDLGFFSIDPEGAMRANVDTTRAKLYAGIRNMGENSPVSKEGLDYTSQKFTEMWTAAMSGRDVDARTTIDVQRLRDFFGIDLTPAALLTGQREGKTATDVQLDVMKKVETQLDKLNSADETTKGQIIDSLKNVLGEEMINSIVSNYNKNIRIDSKDLQLTVAEKLEQAGTSTLNLRDLTEKTTASVLALSNLKNSLEELKNTLVEDFAPAFVKVTETLTSFVDWLNGKMTKKEKDTVTPGGLGSSTVLNKDLKSTDAGDVFGDNNERKLSASEKLKEARSANDVLDAIYELNPNLKTEGSLENLKKNQYINDAYDALASGELDENSTNPFERYLANYEYGGKKGIEALRLAEKDGVFGKLGGMKIFREAIKGKRLQRPQRSNYIWGPLGAALYKNAENDYQGWFDALLNSQFFANFATPEFGEGGGSDWTEEKGKFDYVMDPSYYKTADDWYDALQKFKDEMKDFGKEYIKNFTIPSKEDLWGTDKKLQFDEVRFVLELTDGRVVSSFTSTPKVSDFQ